MAALLNGEATLTIPAGTGRRVVVDLGDYYCAYPQLTLSGGAGSTVRIYWAESLFEAAGQPRDQLACRQKGNRDQIEGKCFKGTGDSFITDGGQNRQYETLWWEAGRYLEIVVLAAGEPLTIEGFSLRQTHYPFDWKGRFQCSDERLNGIIGPALRTMEMCSHETYMDCPYYEQLQWLGDARIEALVTYAMTDDDRLPVAALTMFDASRRPDGLTMSRYPSWEPVRYRPVFTLVCSDGTRLHDVAWPAGRSGRPDARRAPCWRPLSS